MTNEQPATEPSILIVHRSKQYLEVLSNLLISMGYLDIILVETMEKALESINNLPITFVICESELPHQEAFGFLKLVRQQGRFKDLRFLIISSSDKEEQTKKSKAVSFGADKYLSFPFIEKDFKIAVQNILAKKP